MTTRKRTHFDRVMEKSGLKQADIMKPGYYAMIYLFQGRRAEMILQNEKGNSVISSWIRNSGIFGIDANDLVEIRTLNT